MKKEEVKSELVKLDLIKSDSKAPLKVLQDIYKIHLLSVGNVTMKK